MTLEDRIKQMLAESAAKREENTTKLFSLTEAELDEMSDDEIADIDPDQIDELSIGLLNSYKAKAMTNRSSALATQGKDRQSFLAAKTKPDQDKSLFAMKNSEKTIRKRTAGINAAFTKESLDEMSEDEIADIDIDQLDELSKATLGSYIKKSAKDSQMATKFADTDAKYNKTQFSKDAIKTRTKRNDGISQATDRLTKEGTEVSSQVTALLEAEGLSEEFKLQAVTIFEAAVTDRVLQLTEELELQYEEKLNEAKAEIEDNIDGFLNETVQRWATDNEVAIQNNFKTRLAESFMDGLKALITEHNIELPVESENALDIALDQVNTLEESVEAAEAKTESLQEQVDAMKAEQILESFKAKMTATEFDRFEQLTESVNFINETQYNKQLSIVMENFGKKPAGTKQTTVITEEVQELPEALTIVTETNSAVNRYAAYMQGNSK